MTVFLAGWVVLVVVLLLAQMRFYNAHQRAHNHWKPRADPWMLARSRADYRAMLRATFRRDGDSRVESLRRQYVAVLGIVAVYAVVGFPIAGLLLS